MVEEDPGDARSWPVEGVRSVTDTLGLLSPWIAGQRWYGNKGGSPKLELIGSCPLHSPDPDARIVVHFVLDHAEGKAALYQVPISYRAREEPWLEFALIGHVVDNGGITEIGEEFRFAYDAPHDPAFTTALLEGMLQGSAIEGQRVSLAGERTTEFRVSGLRSSVLAGEQSNTSIIFSSENGDTPPVICKLFRALHGGDNPDVELQSALAAAGSTRVPRSLGNLSGEWPDSGEPTGRASGHLAFAQEFIPGVEDAWRVALRSAEAGEDFTAAAHALGLATAEIHATLALALPSTPTTPADIAAMLHQFDDRLESAIREVPHLHDLRARIERVFDAAREAQWPHQQRIHGDFHLGQVLLAPDRGWVIVDFEGEPLRPMRDRTLPDIPLRDVAGMLRSFDYVAGCLALEKSIDATEWAHAARTSFVDGYIAGSGYDVRENRTLLDAFEIDKALYETVYEARNRPSWVDIPVSAVRRLASRAAERDPTSRTPFGG